jgi:hypothetical protein
MHVDMYSVFNGEAGSLKRLSLDRLVYFTTCKIGHHVEVHLRNGSVYTGIFHAANVEKDFGEALNQNFFPYRAAHTNSHYFFLQCIKLLETSRNHSKDGMLD